MVLEIIIMRIFIKNLDDFENNLISSIRIVAIMRLVIDPFPLLLADEEIYYRSPNIMTYPFNEKLLEVMGEESIAEFKNTDVYKSYEEELMKLEKRNQEVNNIVMADYIDLDNLENIYLQKHLLNHQELKYVDIASCSENLRTGRLHPCAGAEPAEQHEEVPRSDLPVHRPRPVGRPVHLGPHRRHQQGPHRGAGRG